MCLTVVAHYTKCETRRRAIINPDSGYAIYHPLEPPPPCRHQRPDAAFKYCSSHGTCCTQQKWQFCYSKTITPVCFAWQTLHMILSEPCKGRIIPDIAKSVELSQRGFPFTDKHDRYGRIRHDFFNAAANVARWVDEANLIGNEIHKEPSSQDQHMRLWMRFKEVLRQWEHHYAALKQLTNLWNGCAEDDMIELCPSNLFEFHAFSGFFQNAPAPYFEIVLAPYRWRRVLEQAGIRHIKFKSQIVKYQEQLHDSHESPEDLRSAIEECGAGEPPPVFTKVNWQASATSKAASAISPKTTNPALSSGKTSSATQVIEDKQPVSTTPKPKKKVIPYDSNIFIREKKRKRSENSDSEECSRAFKI
ncbi:hypothetical protein G7Z17_g2043 [Cylindrodendrum hubeiense]|uniref:Uncharacterized protein n=1 Tax=Cylindrodendrum hubeiense TaxID=595255 RepID=A0A9P5HDJ9_9HYPO|nr:hypothetical protein G7Z17_g2043 [Cylindrodendrum hubeiense]